MDTTIIRSIIIRSVMIFSILVLLSGCSNGGGDSKVNDENVNLTSLELSAGTLSPLFDANTIAYSVQVANDVSSITVTPTAADSNSTITVNGQAVSSGAASQSMNLSVGLTTITIVVTAQDGTTTKTYTVAITRLEGVSHNADLAGLSLSGGGILSPAFTANWLAYTAEVADDVSSIKATPTAADANSIITVNGQAVSSGSASQSMNLSVGPNTVTIVVTAQDETTTKTYIVVITRLAGVSHNANLAGLTLATGSPLSPLFTPSTTAYTAEVANDVSSITVTPTAADSNSTLTVNGKAVSSGEHSQSITLSVGPNTVTIVVTAQDGTTTKTYTVGITRLAGVSHNADLAGLSLSTGSALSPVFTPNTTAYTARVANNVSLITVMPTAADSNSTITVNGEAVISGTPSQSIDLDVGPNTITIVVTAQDGTTTKTYTVTVTRNNGFWTWVSGDNTTYHVGIYGTTGVPEETNIPGSRYGSITWTDSSGNLWLFGGYGLDGAWILNNLNDLWKFDGTNWTWMSGDSTANHAGIYGTKGVAEEMNVPGSRRYSISWTDSGNLWLFGGEGLDGAGNPGYLNDLWKFDGTNWTWVSGDSTINHAGIYEGAEGTNIPGSRYGSISWTDSENFWLFGGNGYDSAGNPGYLNDLWKFDGTNWTWVSGDNTADLAGIYGTMGVTLPTNVPGSRRYSISWTDSGNLWLFGGEGLDGAENIGTLNDLWKFDGTNWTWVSGDTTAFHAGIYGTMGVTLPTNVPGSRYGSISWTDSSGNLWLFGGEGLDGAGTIGSLNDLWKFDGTNWTWVSGDTTADQAGIYGGAEGTNMPGSRKSSISWTDSSGNLLWLFGGYGFDSAGSNGYLNDLWKFEP